MGQVECQAQHALRGPLRPVSEARDIDLGSQPDTDTGFLHCPSLPGGCKFLGLGPRI